MPSHMSLPTLPPGAGSNLCPPPIPAPNVENEPRESADSVPATGEAMTDRVAEEVFGSEENARNTAGLTMSFAAPRPRLPRQGPWSAVFDYLRLEVATKFVHGSHFCAIDR